MQKLLSRRFDFTLCPQKDFMKRHAHLPNQVPFSFAAFRGDGCQTGVLPNAGPGRTDAVRLAPCRSDFSDCNGLADRRRSSLSRLRNQDWSAWFVDDDEDGIVSDPAFAGASDTGPSDAGPSGAGPA